MDGIRQPNVVNVLKQGEFTLNIVAYRTLNRNEMLMAAGEYLKREKKLRTLPKHGTDTIVTIIGHDGP